LGREKTEMATFRLRSDQLAYIDRLAEERDGTSRSSIIRDIITFHRAVMTTDLAEEHFVRILEDLGYEVTPPQSETG